MEYPDPLTAPESDLQDFAFMPLHVARLRDSDLAGEEHPEACWYAVLLWAAAWHQLPAGSLPDNDVILMRLVGIGRDEKTWRKHKSGALRGFIKCADGRLYHPVVAEQVNSAWAEKLAYRDRKEKRKEAGKQGAESKWSGSAESPAATRSQRLAEARKIAKHTKAEWEALLAACDSECVRCGSEGPIVKDHITPIYQGGSDGIENLQPLCQSCNSSKGSEAIDHRPNAWLSMYERLLSAGVRDDGTPSISQAFVKQNASRKGEGQGEGEGIKEKVPLSNESGADRNSDQRFWSDAVAFLGGEKKRAMVGKWCRDFGQAETAQAITAAQLERAVEPVAYIQRVLRGAAKSANCTADGWELPIA